MSVLKVNHVSDIAGLGGFTFSSGSITCNGTLKVGNISINGSISGSSSYIIPSFSGQSGRFLSNNGSSLTWSSTIVAGGAGTSGFRSMQVWTNNGTWYRPSGVTSIKVQVIGAGGGGSGWQEGGGCGGFSERVIDVTGTSSVNVSVGNPGSGTSYSGCGGNGNTSSFGSYCNASGGIGANCSQNRCGGYGGNGSGGNFNSYGGGGTGYGDWSAYGHCAGSASYFGGSQPSSNNQDNYAYNHQSHAAWGSGGTGAKHSNRGAGGRDGCVVVFEYAG